MSCTCFTLARAFSSNSTSKTGEFTCIPSPSHMRAASRNSFRAGFVAEELVEAGGAGGAGVYSVEAEEINVNDLVCMTVRE